MTQPDRPAGRGGRLTPPPVKTAALARGLPVWQPATLRDPAVVEQLRALAPQVIVVVAYGELLRRAVLELAPHGCVNVHPSLLPRWRGPTPIPAAILAGDDRDRGQRHAAGRGHGQRADPGPGARADPARTIPRRRWASAWPGAGPSCWWRRCPAGWPARSRRSRRTRRRSRSVACCAARTGWLELGAARRGVGPPGARLHALAGHLHHLGGAAAQSAGRGGRATSRWTWRPPCGRTTLPGTVLTLSDEGGQAGGGRARRRGLAGTAAACNWKGGPPRRSRPSWPAIPASSAATLVPGAAHCRPRRRSLSHAKPPPPACR